MEQDDQTSSSQPSIGNGSPPRKESKRGHYCTYSMQFKMSVIEETFRSPISVVAEKYGVPRSTITSWETQLRRMNKPTFSNTARGIHLWSVSGREFTYPNEVDEAIYEWVASR